MGWVWVGCVWIRCHLRGGSEGVCGGGGAGWGIVWFGSRAFKCMEYFGVGGVVGYGLGCGYDWRYGTVWLHGYCRGGGIGFKAVWGR